MAKCGMCMGRGSYDDPPWGIRVCVLCHGTGHDDPNVELWDRKGNVQHNAVERFGEARAQMKRIEQEHAAKSEFQREVEKLGDRAATVGEASERTADEIVAEQQRTHEFVQFADRTRYVANIDPKKGIKPYPEAAQPGQRAGVAECKWSPDSDFEGDTWDSACGEKWSFIDGGPVENRVRFCQGCGGRVVLAAAPEAK